MLAAILLAAFFTLDFALLIFFLTRPPAPKAPETNSQAKPNETLGRGGLLLFWLFAIGWTAATISTDFVAARCVLRHYRASSYRVADGVVLSCAVLEKPGDEGGSTYT